MSGLYPFIRIDGGVIKSSSHTGGQAVEYLDHEIGTVRFFVTLIEDDSSEISLWSGAEYEDAIRVAETTRIDSEIDEPVHDHIAGGSR